MQGGGVVLDCTRTRDICSRTKRPFAAAAPRLCRSPPVRTSQPILNSRPTIEPCAGAACRQRYSARPVMAAQAGRRRWWLAGAAPRIAHNGAETASRAVPGVPRAVGRAVAAMAPAGRADSGPVTGRRTCHRDACRHYRRGAGGRCAPPRGSGCQTSPAAFAEICPFDRSIWRCSSRWPARGAARSC